MRTTPRPWPDDDESKPAPEPLRRIQSLVNTVEIPDGPDRLGTAADAHAWLTGWGFSDGATAPSAEDLALLVRVRESLRSMLVYNAGGPAPTATQLAPLREIAAAAGIGIAVDADGTVDLTADATSLAARLGALLSSIRDAQRDGTWALLKACGNDECRWVFYDASRNHRGTWCDMAACGNKLKNRQFRARQRSTAGVRTGATPVQRPGPPSR